MMRAGKAVVLLGIVLLALSPVASGDQFVTSMKIYLQLNPPSYDKAIVQGEEGLKDSGAAKNWELHAMVAECYASVGRYEEAGKQYQEAMSLNPGKKDVILNGDRKYLSGRDSVWTRVFYIGADLRSKANLDTVALSKIALTDSMKKVIQEQGQPEEVRQGISLGKPLVVFTYWSRGMDIKFREGILVGSSKFKKGDAKNYAELAMKELKGAIALAPEKAQAYEQLAALYDRLGRRNEMVAMLQEALKADPKNAILHTSLGTVYENDGKFDLAVQEFTEATRLDTTIFRAWAGLGESQLNLKHYAEAVQGFQRATAVDSTNKDIFFNFGLAYFNLEKYDNALKAFKRVVAKDPTDCDGWAFVGHSTLNLNDEKGALESYEKATGPACNLTPAYAPSVWQKLCRLYTRKNLMDKAKAACKKAEELAPKK